MSGGRDDGFEALARAFRWRRLLETGVHATVADIAAAEKINTSCVSRILRLTLLAPTSSNDPRRKAAGSTRHGDAREAVPDRVAGAMDVHQ
ncbi:hypothetical protein [Elioraea sp.]|uniref:hypothetical protein n=1 Tax=Elioraea sp. TaxID=2185103 RepID=UPI00307CC932